jgi:hypothetical protein
VVRSRVLIGVGAWLLGAVTATGGSLLAVSQLGQGLVDKTNQQLTASAINSALASEKAEQSATSPARTAHPAPAAHAVHAVKPAPQDQHAAPTSSPSPPTSPPGTLLASAGGTVLATCQAAGAYLLSWSPQQDFEVQDVVRGPSPVVSVRFSSPSQSLTMQVTCHGGLPAVLRSGWGGGEGGDE